MAYQLVSPALAGVHFFRTLVQSRILSWDSTHCTISNQADVHFTIHHDPLKSLNKIHKKESFPYETTP